jgi:protein-L-isoaspartate(D-aspartate) O-methyltransferase
MGPQEAQLLTVIDKDPAGRLEARELIPVRFTQLETV